MLEIMSRLQCISDRNAAVSPVRIPNIVALIDRSRRVFHPELAFDSLIYKLIK
jgi:hypothetical protein